MPAALHYLFTVISWLPRSIRETIMPDMLIPPIANHPQKVQLRRISHVYFEHPDLTVFKAFAKDFGFIESQSDADKVYFRGYGIDPYVYVASKSADGHPRFLGAAFVASSRDEFDKAAALPGAELKSLEDAPGGGSMVTFKRPDSTFFHVVHGQTERETGKEEPTATHVYQGDFNKPFNKPRQGLFRG